jgi:magnesium-transporting ATPase (P-type)
LKEEAVTICKIYFSFFRSLVWVIFIVTWTIFFFLSADVINVDFLHVNPNRTQSHAAMMPFIFAPFIFIAVLFIAMTFSCSQFVQAFLAKELVQKYGSRGLYGIVLSVPMAAVLSWYCYDYLTPSDINLGIGPEWRPYQHGLTL